MLNLGVRQSVGAEPEVQVNALTGGLGVVEFIRQQRLFDLLRQCDVVVTSPQVRLRLTSGYHKLDGYAARGAYHSLIKLYVGILRTFFYCFHPILCLIVGEWGCVRRLPWGMDEKKGGVPKAGTPPRLLFQFGLM